MSRSKTLLIAEDVFTGEKLQILIGTSSTVQVPIVSEKNYVFVDLDRTDGSLIVLDGNGQEKYFSIKRSELINEFTQVIDGNGGDLSLVVTTLCSMGLEEPKSIHVEDENM